MPAAALIRRPTVIETMLLATFTLDVLLSLYLTHSWLPIYTFPV